MINLRFLGLENKKPFIEVDQENFTISHFNLSANKGYEKPINKITGEQLPNCCTYHSTVYKKIKEWFDKFPNCCDPHREMSTKWWFNKNKYHDFPYKIVSQLSITEHHIKHHIGKKDWFGDITDFIDYNISSFGFPAIGLHLYLGNLKNYILNKGDLEISQEKRQKLAAYIDTTLSPEKIPDFDINLLISTYQLWLNSFPFDLSYFKHLKQNFENQLPILKGKPVINRYSGIAKGQILSRNELIDILSKMTRHLLNQVNTRQQLKKGEFKTKDPSFELIVEKQRLKQAKLLGDYSKSEQKYLNILIQWLKNEQDFFKEIKSFFASKNDLLNEILEACSILQGNPRVVNGLENYRNSFITHLLSRRGIVAKDQSQFGISSTGKQAGEVDIKIENERGKAIAIIEAFNLSYLDTKVIDLHLNKIFRYDLNGLRRNFIIIYSEASDFKDLWRKYITHLSSIDFEIQLINPIKDISKEFQYGSEVKVGLAEHLRNEEIIEVVHVFLNMKN